MRASDALTMTLLMFAACSGGGDSGVGASQFQTDFELRRDVELGKMIELVSGA